MAHSRLEKIGTIYSRVSNLIKSGATKLEDRPLWFDVYEAFPPKYPPQFNRPYPDDEIKPIFYPEDLIRAKFYKAMRNAPVMNISDTSHQTLSQKCIELCTKIKRESNVSVDEAFDKALESIKANTDKKTIIEDDETEKKSLQIKSLFE